MNIIYWFGCSRYSFIAGIRIAEIPALERIRLSSSASPGIWQNNTFSFALVADDSALIWISVLVWDNIDWYTRVGYISHWHGATFGASIIRMVSDPRY